jgi:type II secretion system protein N
MSSITGAFSRFLFYFCYAVVFTAVLLYARFPTAKFKEYCVRQCEELFAGTDCKIARLAYAFPFGLSLQDVAFSLPDTKSAPLVLLHSVTVSPDFMRLGNEFDLNGKGYSGEFSSTLQLAKNSKGFSLKNLKIENLNLAEMKPLQDALGREVSGRLSFAGSYSAVVNQYLAGKGQGKVSIDGGKLSLVQPVLALEAIDLQHIDMEIQYGNQTLQIAKGKMKGKELTADFASTVQVVSPWFASALAMTGDIAPQAGFMKDSVPARAEVRALQKQFKKPTIPFRMGGSVQKPSFQFGL